MFFYTMLTYATILYAFGRMEQKDILRFVGRIIRERKYRDLIEKIESKDIPNSYITLEHIDTLLAQYELPVDQYSSIQDTHI